MASIAGQCARPVCTGCRLGRSGRLMGLFHRAFVGSRADRFVAYTNCVESFLLNNSRKNRQKRIERDCVNYILDLPFDRGKHIR